MPQTKGSILRFYIAFALSGVRVQLGRQFFKLGLSEEQRYDVADRVVSSLRDRHGYRDLDEPVEPPPVVPQYDYGKRKE